MICSILICDGKQREKLEEKQVIAENLERLINEKPLIIYYDTSRTDLDDGTHLHRSICSEQKMETQISTQA
jgi:hypothetical protein